MTVKDQNEVEVSRAELESEWAMDAKVGICAQGRKAFTCGISGFGWLLARYSEISPLPRLRGVAIHDVRQEVTRDTQISEQTLTDKLGKYSRKQIL